jgi:hypothetical protein
MRKKNDLTKWKAAEMTATLFGILAGMGGMTHGVGEILQGNVAPEGIIINSWAEGPIATKMGGEPGMTIVPNLLVTGVLTFLFSLAVLVWAALFVRRRHGGRVLIVLSIGMLLVGGGFGPPIIGILAGLAGREIGAPQKGGYRRLPPGAHWFLARLWPYVFGVAALAGTFLVAGSLILVYLFGVDNADLFLNTFYVTVLSLIFAVLAAPVRDRERADRSHVVLRYGEAD